jgi:rhomboid-related protein 1/2/3
MTNKIAFSAACDVGFAIYSRYESAPSPSLPSVSFIAHITGALAGLTIGLIVLKNFEQRLHEQLLWWIALGLYSACIIFAIIYNIVNSGSNFVLDEDESYGTPVMVDHQNF